MNKEQIEQCREKIESLLSEYSNTEASSREASQTVELDQSKVGRLSRMDALQQQAMSLEQKRRRQEETKALKKALLDLREGDYGWCEACGEEINFPRLLVNPSTRFCFNCADKHST